MKQEVINLEFFGAVQRGDFKAIKQYFRLYADVNWNENVLKTTPLMIAVMERDYATVRLLLSMGADIKIINFIEEDVFTFAEEYQLEDNFKMVNLLKKGS